MPKKHISVVKATVVWLLAVFLILGGLVSLGMSAAGGDEAGVAGGLGLLVFGFVLAGVNKLVFTVRTTQLNIDMREGVRDAIGCVCPDCGHRLSQGSAFCNKCGYKI